MGNENQSKQEGGTGTGQIQNGYRYSNSNTTNKPSFKRNTTELEDEIFSQGRPSDSAKYEDSIKILINYVQRECSMGVYLGQATREVKVTDLAILNKSNKCNNQLDAAFYMEVLEWKENTNTVFIRRRNIEEGNKKLYSLLSDQCVPSLKTKPTG